MIATSVQPSGHHGHAGPGEIATSVGGRGVRAVLIGLTRAERELAAQVLDPGSPGDRPTGVNHGPGMANHEAPMARRQPALHFGHGQPG